MVVGVCCWVCKRLSRGRAEGVQIGSTEAGILTRMFSFDFPRSAPQSMKMIASTKLTKAQRAMNSARIYGQTNEGESMVFDVTDCCGLP